MADRIDVGSEVGGYRVTRRIGAGGMGAVFLAEERESGREFALKVLLTELATDEDFRARFQRESRYASSLDHPNIVRVHEFGEADGMAYMVMDYVPGRDLSAELAGGPLSPERTLLILEQIASALDAVHATGLYHRDVKPANILISEESGELHSRLTDFGLSKHPSQDSKPLTSAGFFVGTCQYVAPEQILAEELDQRVDVYSLGCLLFECLTGEPPFKRPREELVIHAHIQDPPPKATALRAELPPAIDDVIEKALAKRPEGRYASCGELIAAAREALGEAAAPPPADAAPAAASAPAAAPVPDANGVNRLRLRVTVGNAQGTEIEVEEDFLIGRQASAEGKLGQDAEISREHARIRRSGDQFVLEDLGSTNGTFLNGRKINRAEILSAGDRIQVGATTLVVQVSVPLAAEPAAPPEPAAEPVAPPEPEAAPEPDAAAEPEPVPAEPLPAEPAVSDPSDETIDVPGPPPPLSLRLRFDPGAGEVTLELDEDSDGVRLVFENGRWRIAPPLG